MIFSLIPLLLKAYYPVIIIIFLYAFNIVSFLSIVACYFLFCLYHRLFTSCALIYTHNNKTQEILSRCPNVAHSSYTPPFLFPINPLQMLCLRFVKTDSKYTFKVSRENINQYGVYIDWIEYEDINPSDSDNILLILPGLTGGFKDPYIENIANEGLIKGYKVGIYQMRILNPNVSVKQNSTFCLIEDLSEAIEQIVSQHPNKSIHAIGYSYGANQLVKYLGEYNHINRRIHSAVSISNPYEFQVASKYTNNTIYDRLLLYFLQKNYQEIRSSLEKDIRFKENSYLLQTTEDIHEFDKYFTCVLLGYQHPTDYYRNISCGPKMKNIDIPLLCIHSQDDAITSADAIPLDDIKANPNIMLVLTDRGSHTCFLEDDGWFKFKQWVVRPSIEFINSVKDINSYNGNKLNKA